MHMTQFLVLDLSVYTGTHSMLSTEWDKKEAFSMAAGWLDLESENTVEQMEGT